MLIFIRKRGTPAILPLITNGANMSLLSPRGKALSSNVQYFPTHEISSKHVITISISRHVGQRTNMPLLSRSFLHDQPCKMVRVLVSPILKNQVSKEKYQKLHLAVESHALLGRYFSTHLNSSHSRIKRKIK